MPVESSPQGAEAEAEVQEDVNTEGSSPTEETETDVEKSMVDVVEQTLNPSEEGSSDSESGTDGKDAEPTQSAEADGEAEKSDELKELTEEEINSYPPNSQRRIRDLVSQKNEVQGQLEELTPKAENYDRLINYMSENRIAPDDLNGALDITRLINSQNYAQALEKIAPIYNELQQKAGEVLPDDLSEQVRLGYIDETHARELHKLRVQEQNSSAQAEEERKQQELDKEAEAWNNQVTTAVNAVEAWAKQKASSDLDWHQKQQDVADKVEIALTRGGREGYPKTEADAIALAEKALEEVEARLKKIRPQPRERKEPVGQGASPHSVAKPKSTREAIEMALEASG